MKVFASIMSLFFGVCGLTCSGGIYEPPKRLNIEMLDVGQGLAFLIRGERCATLYDTGTPKSRIDTMLQNRGVKELCSVVLSHNHNDHTGGMPALEESVRNGNLKIGRVIASWKENWSGGEAGVATRGDTIGDFLPFSARILWAGNTANKAGNYDGELGNDESIVLRISDGKHSFLFMGDLEKEQELLLLQLEPTLDATALQVGHHGSKTSSSWEFLSAVQPKFAFISAGFGNSYGHPHEETLAKLHLVLPDSSKIFRTDKDGALEVEWQYKEGM